MTPNKRDLKAYARFDGTGRVVPGSLVLRRSIPKNGNWKEMQAYECCNPLGAIARCTINEREDQPDPYSGFPYFSMQRAWVDSQYTFTLISLNINGVEYASGQTLTINNPADLELGIGLDGRTYYTNTVDWVNSFIPSSTGLVFYDDFNTVDHPENMLFQIVIQDAPSGYAPGVYYYKYDNLGLLYYNSNLGPIPVTEISWYSVGPDGTYKCSNP
jgi:hypothetical protein